LARDALIKELDYRRDKQWRIFSWTSTLLLAADGGVVALGAKGEFRFNWSLRVVMAVALAVIAAYAWTWIHENITFEAQARADLLRVEQLLGIRRSIPDPSGHAMFGYGSTVALLAIAAIVAVVLVPAASCPSPH